MVETPEILSVSELRTSEAKWITLKKISYRDQDGYERVWESAERKTRKSSGLDAVAILAVIQSKTGAFPLSTVIIEQYRPPIGKFIIELPAGLVDEGETPESAAIRELEEETGYKADKIIDSSSIVVADPGMTNANMKLVRLGITFPDKLETPPQKLDAGEAIVVRVVELEKLTEVLEDYTKKGCVIDAKLSHFAIGYKMAQEIREGKRFSI